MATERAEQPQVKLSRATPVMIRGSENARGGRQDCHTWMCQPDVGVRQWPAVMAWCMAAPITKAASTREDEAWDGSASGVSGGGGWAEV